MGLVLRWTPSNFCWQAKIMKAFKCYFNFRALFFVITQLYSVWPKYKLTLFYFSTLGLEKYVHIAIFYTMKVIMLVSSLKKAVFSAFKFQPFPYTKLSHSFPWTIFIVCLRCFLLSFLEAITPITTEFHCMEKHTAYTFWLTLINDRIFRLTILLNLEVPNIS